MNKATGVNSNRRLVGYLGLSALLAVALACLCGPLSSLPGIAGSLAATPTLMSEGGGSTGGTTGSSDTPGFVDPAQSSLKSFHSKFTMNYSGTKDTGEPTQGTFTMEESHTSDPLASSFQMDGEGAALDQSKVGQTQLYQIGDTTYVVTTVNGAAKCVSMGGSAASGLANPTFSPDAFLKGDLSQARRILPDETVNGVLARHYQFTKDNVSLLDPGWTSYTVDFWTAVDGGYAVKSTFVGDGENISGVGGKGHVEWQFDLLEANTDITIEPPADCSAPAGADIPKMPDAADVIAMGALTNYTTASSVADVVAFYQAQLPAQGWTAGTADVGAATATLEFTKDSQTATITIADSGGKTTVLIQVEG